MPHLLQYGIILPTKYDDPKVKGNSRRKKTEAFRSAVMAFEFYYIGLTIGQITILPRVNGFSPDLL